MANRLMVFIIVIVMAAAASGCHPKNAQTETPPEFFQPHFPQTQTVIASGDTLDIRFYYHPEMNDKVLVRPDGKISLPLHQGIFVAGLSPDELQQKLVEIYSDEFVDPVITVNVILSVTSQVYITGEVSDGGAKPLQANTTISQLLAQCAVKDTDADLHSTVLVRRTEPTTYTAYLVDADIVNGKQRDIYLAPGDVIVVPRNNITVLGDFIKKYISDLIPPQVNLVWGFNYYLNNPLTVD